MTTAQQRGERIRAVRLALGLTQSEFGARLDPAVRQATVARWESGSVPRDHHKLAIAVLAGRPARDLFPLDADADADAPEAVA